MITSMIGCVMHTDLWPWPISSRLLSCDVAYFIDWIYMWHKYNPRGVDVSRTIFRSKVKVTWVVQFFCGRGSTLLIDHRSTNFVVSGYGLSPIGCLATNLTSSADLLPFGLEGTALQWKSNQSFTLKKTYYTRPPPSPPSTKLKGGILVSHRPSICLPICPSVCGQNRVRSVTSTILAGSISYLHNL